MREKINGAILLLSLSMTAVFTACDKKEPSPSTIPVDPEVTMGEIAISTRVGNPDGQDGTGWLQLTDDISPKQMTNKNAIQIPWSAPPRYYGNDIFTLPDFSPTGSLAISKYTRNGKSITKTGELILPAQSLAMEIGFASDTKAYIGTFIGKLIVFNPQTMKQTGEIDFTSYAAPEIPVPLFGGLFIHEGMLYVPIIQVTSKFVPVTAPSVEIVVVDIATDKVVRVMKETQSGISLGPYQYSEPVFTDDKGDIYMVCSGAYGMMPNYKTGILRIKKGATDFDPDYKWVLNDQEIIGDANKGVWLEVTAYAGNGKLYGLMDVPAYRIDPSVPNWFLDNSVMAVEIDIYAKTMKKIDIPLSKSTAPCIAKYKNLIVFGNSSASDNGFYTYNPATGEASKESVIKTSGGTPISFHWFNE